MSDAMGLPGGPAFPISIPGCGDNGCHGMSLRDWFAGQAMVALMSSRSWVAGLDATAKETGYEFKARLAVEAYRMADWMLAQREKKTA